MKILWSVNTVLPDIAEKLNLRRGHAISWVDAMRNELIKRKDIKLAIVCHGGFRVTRIKIYIEDKVVYYVLPFFCDYYDCWANILEDFQPDVIHIYGTERKHNKSLIEKYKGKYPIIISLQGIISEYVKHYYADLSLYSILKNYTINDLLFRNGILEGKFKFWKQSKLEKWMFQSVKYVEGRSDWDYATVLEINPDLKYFYCPRMIRKEFFNYNWCRRNEESYSIFVHQGDYPIKGLHFMIEALRILRKKYPNVKLYVSGNDIFNVSSIKEKGYTKIIKKKICKYDLKNNIIFTGYLTAEQLAKKLSAVSVCVIPSAIENAPNALAEAMIVGTPIVASYVGGNAFMLNYGECGLLYCYNEPQMLAEYVKRIFESDELAMKFSEKAKEKAKQRHNPGELVNRLLSIYDNVIVDCEENKNA